MNWTETDFCVGAVCTMCKKDIPKTYKRAIVNGPRMNYHVCFGCLDKLILRQEEIEVEKEIIKQRLEMKKSLQDFKRRIYGS